MLSICSFFAKLRVNKFADFFAVRLVEDFEQKSDKEIIRSTISTLIEIYQYPVLLLLVLTSDCICLSIPSQMFLFTELCL